MDLSKEYRNLLQQHHGDCNGQRGYHDGHAAMHFKRAVRLGRSDDITHD